MKITHLLAKEIKKRFKQEAKIGLNFRQLLERDYANLEVYVIRETDRLDDNLATTEDAGFIFGGARLPKLTERRNLLRLNLTELSREPYPDNMTSQEVEAVYGYLKTYIYPESR